MIDGCMRCTSVSREIAKPAFFFNFLCDLLEKLVNLPAETLLKSQCDVAMRLRIRKIATVKNYDVVRARLESRVQQFVNHFPHCKLHFSFANIVLEDLTKISP